MTMMTSNEKTQCVGYGYGWFRSSVGMGFLGKFPQVFLWVWDGYGNLNPIPTPRTAALAYTTSKIKW